MKEGIHDIECTTIHSCDGVTLPFEQLEKCKKTACHFEKKWHADSVGILVCQPLRVVCFRHVLIGIFQLCDTSL